MQLIYKPNRIRWYINSTKAKNKYFLVWDKNRLCRDRMRYAKKREKVWEFVTY